MAENKREKVYDFIIWVLVACVYASFTVLNMTEISSIGVIVLLALLTAAFIIRNKGKLNLRFDSLQLHMLVLAGFCIASGAWARSASDAITSGTTIIKILLFVIVVFSCYADAKTIKPLLSATVLGGYMVAAYFIYSYGGLERVIGNSSAGIRNDVDFANVNAIGINMAIVIAVNIALIIDAKKFKWHNIGILLPIVALAACQSRTAFVAAFVGILTVVFTTGAFKGKVFSSIVKVLIVGAILFIVVSQFSIFNGVLGRMESVVGENRDTSSAYRNTLFNFGLKLFSEHPILGIGMGNAHLYVLDTFGDNYYLHNNFAEMLASGGIIGFIIYYSMHARVFFRLAKEDFRKHKYTAVCICILILWLIRDVGGVTYYYKETYWYFLICYLQIGNVRLERESKKAEGQMLQYNNGEK